MGNLWNSNLNYPPGMSLKELDKYTEESPLSYEEKREQEIEKYKDKYIVPVNFADIPEHCYIYKDPIENDDFYYMYDKNEEIYMYDDEVSDYLKNLWQ